MGASLSKEMKKRAKQDVFEARAKKITEIPKEVKLLKCREFIVAENDIRFIPDEVGDMTNVEVLDFANNQITTFPSSLAKISGLKELWFGNNKLFFTAPLNPAIASLKGLIKLDLSNNQLDAMPNELGGLSQLQFFDLSFNALKNIPPEFGNLSKLHHFNCSNNKIVAIPKELGKCTSLQEFDCSNNHLTKIPAELSACRSLRVFNMGFNRITNIPPEYSALVHLVSWDLRDNPALEDICDLSSFKALKSIVLRNVKLSAIPEDLFGLTQIEELDMRQNVQMGFVSRNIGYLVNLKELSCFGMGLKTFPQEIGYLVNLEMLDLRKNDITTDLLPIEIGRLRKLKKLYLANNSITSLPEEIRGIGSSLEELDISNNGMHELCEDVGALTGLIKLRASGNNFQTLPPTIGLLTNLQNLDIHDNKLHELPGEIGELINLRKCELSNNMLGRLPWEMGNLTSPPLLVLNVKANPLLIPPTGIINRGTPAVLVWLRRNERGAGSSKLAGLDYVGTDEVDKKTIPNQHQ